MLTWALRDSVWLDSFVLKGLSVRAFCIKLFLVFTGMFIIYVKGFSWIDDLNRFLGADCGVREIYISRLKTDLF